MQSPSSRSIFRAALTGCFLALLAASCGGPGVLTRLGDRAAAHPFHGGLTGVWKFGDSLLGVVAADSPRSWDLMTPAADPAAAYRFSFHRLLEDPEARWAYLLQAEIAPDGVIAEAAIIDSLSVEKLVKQGLLATTAVLLLADIEFDSQGLVNSVKVAPFPKEAFNGLSRLGDTIVADEESILNKLVHARVARLPKLKNVDGRFEVVRVPGAWTPARIRQKLAQAASESNRSRKSAPRQANTPDARPRNGARAPTPRERGVPSKARGPIIQGFGVTLGQPYAPAKSEQREVVLRWRHKPGRADRSDYFSNYNVWTSPLSKRVVGVGALSEKLALKTCLQQADEVVGVLRALYPKASFVDEVSNGAFFGRGTGAHFLFFKRLQTGDTFIEVSVVADLKVDAKGFVVPTASCYRFRSPTPYKKLGLVFPSLVLSPAYLGCAVGTRAVCVWGYPEGDKQFRPIPAPARRAYAIPDCADTRLCVRYGSRAAERSAHTEVVEAKRRKTLRQGRPRGF